MPNRRNFLKTASGMLAALVAGAPLPKIAWGKNALDEPEGLPAGTLQSDELASLPGKQALIKKTYRPPNYETPMAYFDAEFTPNDRFFVRYHLGEIPQASLPRWTLRIGGEAADNALEFGMDQLRRDFEWVELAALCMCAGNRRGLFHPHVPGIQWGHGAMGNARWKGVRLRDVLRKAGLKTDALEVVLNGADGGVLEKTPDFAKSLPLAKALDEHTLIAFEMNGAPLPHWNGFPARLVVPGWAATYWVKHLTSIEVASTPYDGFWMKTAYRVPRGIFPNSDGFTSQATETTVPITELLVNALIVAPAEGQEFSNGKPVVVKGVAWDGGHGMERVEISSDDGKTWQAAKLGADHGPYSWRTWSFDFMPAKTGPVSLKVRASNRIGQVQPAETIANPAGYHHNAVQTVAFRVI